MRGILLQYLQENRRKRIIPAHAGNTRFLLMTTRAIEDHPRSCGEYYEGKNESSYEKGSSPLMRGILDGSIESSKRSRIIPAHAGNTDLQFLCRLRNRDHPRSCGEYDGIRSHWKAIRGSSPLMRGIRIEQNVYKEKYRIIPAHAGNTDCR